MGFSNGAFCYLIASLTSASRPDVDPKPHDPIESVYDLLANMPYESSAASTTTQTGSATATNPKKKVKIDEADRAKWKVHLRAGGGGSEGEKWFAIHGASQVGLARAAVRKLTLRLSCRPPRRRGTEGDGLSRRDGSPGACRSRAQSNQSH